MNNLWRRVEVAGDSMFPTLRAGDRLLVLRWPRRLLRPGHLVAVDTPERAVVKRIAAVTRGRVDLRGDNAGASTDYPDTPLAAVLGRVVYRYAPNDRAGRVH
jgi:phage repressor protein C with HTH and peptisase S24 domain